jgi:hypothetical protein
MTVKPPLSFSDYWISFVRLIAIAIILTGIAVGAKATYVPLSTSRIFGEEVDADLKLALLGFFNKSLDVFLVSSLEYMACFIQTLWMVHSDSPSHTQPARGATFGDFGLWTS